MSFFRAEVIKKKHDGNIFGDVILIRPISFSVYTAVLFIFVVLLGLLLFYGHYASKETVKGVLNPKSGLVKVYAPKRGIVTSRSIDEGNHVTKGDLIYYVSTARYLNGGKDLQSMVVQENEKLIRIVSQQIKEQKQLSWIKKTDLERRINYAELEVSSIEREIVIHEKRIKLYAEDVSVLEKISADQFVPKSNYIKSYQIFLNGELELIRLKRSLTNKINRKFQLVANLEKLPIELKQSLLSHEKAISEFQQRISAARSNQNYSILAPASGRVTSLLYNVGETIKPDFPLLTILPDDTPLKADLYVPTRAAGFLYMGQEVKIRFDAFPYQKFGIYGGVIEQISRNIMISGEVTLPFNIKEPVYKVSVKLEKQTVLAFGREHYLQVGMLLKGDIIRDRNRIIDWILEPLYSLKGRGQ